MPTPGYVFKDGGPLPDSEVKDSQGNEKGTMEPASRTSTSNSSTANTINTPSSGSGDVSAPSDSHALATSDHEIIGAVQKDHKNGEVRDMGWLKNPKHVPKELVGGLSNEELWTLMRRFNKQMYHVKATNAPLLGRLDLNIVDEDEFSPDKLRSNVERLYMTVIIGLMAFGNHIARLRSWRERKRTATFCAVSRSVASSLHRFAYRSLQAYMVAWVLNLIMPLLVTTLIVLIMVPPARTLLFPPAPLALVDSKSGGVKSPPAGVLGSHDSATGAPEKHQGEAVEQEAHNFVTGIGTIALSSAAGKHEQADPEKSPVDESIPDPTNIAKMGAESKVAAAGGIPTTDHDKTKQPMQEAMWVKMRPIMHVIGDIADGWERFGNALSPTPPFPRETPRLQLAAVVVPLLAVSLFTSSAFFMKIMGAGFGFGFFGDPLIWRGLDILNEKVPNWQKYLELRKFVPTPVLMLENI